MAKSVKWSPQAREDRKQILAYWAGRNKSKTYSIKLNKLFKEALSLIREFPNIGVLTDFEDVRNKVVRDYSIFYKETGEIIYILRIWDNRQDPEELRI